MTEAEFLEAVTSTVERYSLLQAGEKVLVAYSGGPDSTALLYALHKLQARFELKLVAAHLNHGLRSAAERDEAVCRRMAKRLGVPLLVERAELGGKPTPRGVEELARTYRRDFLKRAAAQAGATKIATGHTRNDRVESLLMNMVRGCGLAGLVGIKAKALPFIRPLLELGRDEVRAFADSTGLEWVVDESNYSLDLLRNRVRHLLLPFLEREVTPGAFKTLSRLAGLAEAAVEVLEEHVSEEFNSASTVAGGVVRLRLGPLRERSEALRALLFLQAIKTVAPDIRDIAFAHIEQINRLLASEGSSKRVILPTEPPIEVCKEYDELVFSQPQPPQVALAQPIELPVPGEVELPDGSGCLVAKWIESPPESFPSPQEAVILPEAEVQLPLKVRFPREGDRFQPFGGSGHKKVARFLMEAKVPHSKRAKVPLLCDERGILWLVGLRADERIRIRDNRTRAILVEFIPKT